MKPEILKKLQQTELEVMMQIDEICRKYDINYSIYAGTQIGAVRHGGFIPWDDDIDICMDRNDYDRFIKAWEDENPTGYVMQDPRRIDGITINHTKIMKEGTIFSYKKDLDAPGFHGIFVDIFPFDKVPCDPKKKKKLKLNAVFRLIYTRGYPMKNGGKAKRIITEVMLAIPKSLQKKIKNSCEKKVTKYKDLSEDYVYMDLSCPEMLSIEFPKNLFAETEDILFDEKPLKNSKYGEDMLTLLYGDYMKLPPEEERICKHEPDIIKF